MITIIGDTCEELIVLQSVIDKGLLNAYDMPGITFDATYKLSSGNLILADKHGNIVGEKSKDCNSCKHQNEVDGSNCYECVKGIHDNYKADTESEG